MILTIKVINDDSINPIVCESGTSIYKVGDIINFMDHDLNEHRLEVTGIEHRVTDLGYPIQNDIVYTIKQLSEDDSALNKES